MSFAVDDAYYASTDNGDNDKSMVEVIEKLGFDKVKRLGEGGMGMAYRGKYLKDGTVRVLKVNKPQSETTDDDLLEEGSRLKSLAHPHVAVR